MYFTDYHHGVQFTFNPDHNYWQLMKTGCENVKKTAIFYDTTEKTDFIT